MFAESASKETVHEEAVETVASVVAVSDEKETEPLVARDVDVGDVGGSADELEHVPPVLERVTPSASEHSLSGHEVAGSAARVPPPPRVNPDTVSGIRFFTEYGGRISYYSHFGGRKQFFECECPNRASHGRCILTRALPSTFSLKAANRGRMVGYLVAWLMAAYDPSCQTKEQHREHLPTVHARIAARQSLDASEHGRRILAVERAKEPEEPEGHDVVYVMG